MNIKFIKLKRYIISIKSAVFVGVLFVISLGVYCVFTTHQYISNNLINELLKNSLLIISTITGTNLLTSAILETDNKNQEWRNIISTDFLSNANFYSNMDDKTKWDIFLAIKCSINGDNNMVQDEITSSILKKMKFENEEFYFEKCAYDVKCTISNNYIEYVVARRTELYSYKKKFVCDKFRVAIVANMCDNELGIRDISVKLNGRQLSDADLIIEKEAISKEADIERNGYNEIKYIYLRDPLELYSKNEEHNCVTMVYSYTARTALNDLVSSYRASQPCKCFSVKFDLLSKEKYQLVTNTFGFLDSSKGEDDTNNDYTSYSEFKDWIFEDDGVIVSIVPRPELKEKEKEEERMTGVNIA